VNKFSRIQKGKSTIREFVESVQIFNFKPDVLCEMPGKGPFANLHADQYSILFGHTQNSNVSFNFGER
jgi:hypothetical protein